MFRNANVSEWVSDFYSKDYYQVSPVKNPAGPVSGTKRVVRGLDSGSDDAQLMSSRRSSRDPNDRNETLGFRIVVALANGNKN
jgi:formylglycine-generating enzyme required for sulfatase activity